MSQVILTNWTIYFADDAPAGSSGYKQIRWTGAGSPANNTNTILELYSTIQHFFSLPGNNDFNDSAPMRAVTPTLYEIGSFDAGDTEPWFIDPVSVQHLTGGGLNTVKWTRVQDSNSGIVKVPYTGGTPFVTSDIGRTIVNGTATGTLLYYANNEAWIRPTNSTSTHNWAGPAGTISVTGGTGSVTQNGASTTGERVWSNINTIGNVVPNTRFYVSQSLSIVPNFWGTGALDRLFLISDEFTSGLIDKGLLEVFTRQYTKSYDEFTVDVSGGGRTAVPLATQNDFNNSSGYRSVNVTSATSAFSLGEVISGGTSGADAVVTKNTGSPTTSFEYYLIDDLADFVSGETLTGSIVGANGSTSGTPTNVGPSTYTDITITFGQLSDTFITNTGVNGTTEVITTVGTHPFETGNIVVYSKQGGTDNVGIAEGTLYYVRNLSANTLSLHASSSDASSDISRVNLTSGSGETHLLARTFDVNEDASKDNFSIIINGAGRSLLQIFERTKYLTLRGGTTNLNGIEGQQYIGIDRRVDYNTLTGTISSGDIVTQVTASGKTSSSFVVHHNVIDKYLMLRRSKGGSFDVGTGAANLEKDGSNFVTMTGSSTTANISPVKISPFGTYAGGQFFGARGVFIENILSSDQNNYQLTDDSGSILTPSVAISLSFSGLISNSELRIYDSSDNSEIAGTESTGATFSYNYLYTSDTNIYIIIFHVNYKPIRLDLTLTSVSQAIPVQQVFDRVYS